MVRGFGPTGPGRTLLDAGGDEGHGDVALDAVDADPGRHQRQHPRHQVHQLRGLGLVLGFERLGVEQD